jgi:hypothetical protein
MSNIISLVDILNDDSLEDEDQEQEQEQQVSARQIYELLFAGKKLQMHFSTIGKVRSFSTRIYKLKKSQEEQLVGCGFMKEEDRNSFKIEYDEEKKLATFSFVVKKPLKRYVVEIVE